MQKNRIDNNKKLAWSLYLANLLLFGFFLFFTTSLLVGCGECQFDTDCTGNSLCKSGRCVGLRNKEPKQIPDASLSYDYSQPPTGSCLEGEVRACFTGSAQTRRKGECKDGKQSCSGGQWGTCTGSITATPEVCDNKDNDCNGLVDDNVPNMGNACIVSGQKGPCSQGKWACTQGKMICTQVVQSKTEICGNGQDEDCDGRPDQTPPCTCTAGTTQACYVTPDANRNKGECKDGQQICSTAQKWGTCLGETKPSPEICDNKDNNCNGLVDDDLQRPCGITKGLCVQGKQSCIAGIWSSVCTGEIKPTSEICDNKDNNCNGQTDENLTKTCSVPCGTGSQSCTNGGWTRCKPANEQSEICNNKDDDCDGQVDENLSQACRSKCGTGRAICDRGQWIKCTAPLPQTEICDGKDNDCDGQVDESPGSEKQLTKDASQSIYDFVTASDGKSFAVAYATDKKNLYFARFDLTGKAIGSPQLVISNAISPPSNLHLLWTGRYFGLFWNTYRYNTVTRKYEYYYDYTRFTSAGTRNLTRRIFPVKERRITINIAWNGLYFGVVWISQKGTLGTLVKFMRLYDTGYPAGNNVEITTATSSYKYAPEITAGGSYFGVVWSDYRNKKRELYFQKISSTGVKSGPEVAVTQTTYSPYGYVISGNSSYFVVAYRETTKATNRSQLFTSRIYTLSSIRYGNTQITNATSGYISNNKITTSSTYSARDQIASWTGSSTGKTQFYIQRLTNRGTILFGSKATQVFNATSYFYRSTLSAFSDKIYGAFWIDQRTGKRQVWLKSMCGF